MNPNKRNIELLINKIPTMGILFYVLLYIYSSTLYPGGSQANLNAEGFDWINNYWCNLMNEKGGNGVPNPARSYSIFAMIILCFSLMVFFIQFAEVFAENLFWKRTIKFGGIFSMLFAILMFTKYHDVMTIISSLFGMLVLIGIIKEVYRSELTNYKISAILCMLLLGINNYIYYSQHLIEWLPLLQKITLAIVLIWILGLNHELNKKIKASLA